MMAIGRFGIEIEPAGTAYVLTRPLGASVADWLGKPHDVGGGLAFGDGTVTAVAVVVIVALVAWVTVNGADTQRELSASSS
jgi:uncharacterized membrane-anchored protein